MVGAAGEWCQILQSARTCVYAECVRVHVSVVCLCWADDCSQGQGHGPRGLHIMSIAKNGLYNPPIQLWRELQSVL